MIFLAFSRARDDGRGDILHKCLSCLCICVFRYMELLFIQKFGECYLLLIWYVQEI